MASKKKSNYVTIEERFGKGAKLPGRHRGGFAVESAGLLSDKVQKKLTDSQERKVVGERMRYVKSEMEGRTSRSSDRSTDERSMVFGRDKTKPPQ